MALLGATLVLAGLVPGTGTLTMVVLVPAGQRVLEPIWVHSTAVQLAGLLLVVGMEVYALVKFCVLPVACFVGEYGPMAPLRATWRITSLRTAKAVSIMAVFVWLLALGVVLDTRLGDPTSPVALSPGAYSQSDTRQQMSSTSHVGGG